MMSFPFRDRTTEKELIDSSAWDRYFGPDDSWLRLPHSIGQAGQPKNNLIQALNSQLKVDWAPTPLFGRSGRPAKTVR
jgi:hypothetical protein